MNIKPIHPDFLKLLLHKDEQLCELFLDLRNFIIESYPECNELLYHTHALSTVFAISDKLGDAFCMINIYTNHFNLGFNKGTLLNDPHQLLSGTGNLIRHIDIQRAEDYRNDKVRALLASAIQQSISDMVKPTKITGQSVSKIKK